MRLLNAQTLEMKEFLTPPRYAILSHRWGDDEVSFEDYVLATEDPTDLPSKRLVARANAIRNSNGWRKINEFCAFVRGRGEAYWAWIDTCCIDKRSSAELSEAINSMWNWYKCAFECYVYLSDVPDLPQNDKRGFRRFRRSSWLELLAPTGLIFCTAQWQIIGYLGNVQKLVRRVPMVPGVPRPSLEEHNRLAKQEYVELAHEVHEITRIPVIYLAKLADGKDLSKASIAQRMSWASTREATRVEDVAYSLFGLFNVNIPLLYGEGTKAFLRLQKEIIGQSDDESIFVWSRESSLPTNILAPSPAMFQYSGDVVRRRDPKSANTVYRITNKGMELIRDGTACATPGGTVYSFPLNCEWIESGRRCELALRFTDDDEKRFVDVRPHSVALRDQRFSGFNGLESMPVNSKSHFKGKLFYVPID